MVALSKELEFQIEVMLWLIKSYGVFDLKLNYYRYVRSDEMIIG